MRVKHWTLGLRFGEKKVGRVISLRLGPSQKGADSVCCAGGAGLWVHNICGRNSFILMTCHLPREPHCTDPFLSPPLIE